IGSLMASETFKLLTGIGEPLLGRVAAYDARTGRIREIEYRRDPDAPRPGSLEERTAVPEERPDRNIDVLALADELGSVAPPVLVDVREPWEAQLASIPGSTLIPLGQLRDRLDELDRDAEIVLYCHTGVRSGHALQWLEQSGFEHARNLTGGIAAWSAKVDPSVPTY